MYVKCETMEIILSVLVDKFYDKRLTSVYGCTTYYQVDYEIKPMANLSLILVVYIAKKPSSRRCCSSSSWGYKRNLSSMRVFRETFRRTQYRNTKRII